MDPKTHQSLGAMLYGSPRALEALLERGASPYVENGSQELPLHLMAEFGPGHSAEADAIDLCGGTHRPNEA